MGDNLRFAMAKAREISAAENRIYISPYDDLHVIEGQATIGLEIMNDVDFEVDYLLACVGGGGLISGLTECMRQLSPRTKVIGFEPLGCPSMKNSLENGYTELDKVDTFIDGASVPSPGKLAYVTHLSEHPQEEQNRHSTCQ